MPCHAHLAQLRQHADAFRRLGAEVVVVSFEPLEQLERYAREERLPFPVLSDPERVAYRAFGLAEASLGRLFSPGTVWVYARELLRGRWPRVRRAKFRQLGGDVVIAADGKVALLHRSVHPADRPAVARLLDVARRSAA